MSLALDTLQQRIVGVLIEKALTTPDAYPLTLNALVAGCNQKSNRDPQMTAEDYEVEGALHGLRDAGWVERVERDGGRVDRYAHQAKAQLGVETVELAILAELLCRGPQAPGALKPRVSRMKFVKDASEVQAHLEAMARRPVPYVTLLPKRPREHHPRWGHLLDGATPDEAVDRARSAGPTEDAPRAPVPLDPTPGPEHAGLAARVAALEDEVARLRDQVERLTGM